MSDYGDTKYIAVAEIPEDQRFSFKITPLPGRMLNAETVGKSIAALAKFNAELGKDIDSTNKWMTSIVNVRLDDDGSFVLDVAVLPIKRKAALTHDLAPQEEP